MTPAELQELQTAFDRAVKTRLMKGESPAEAVPAAAREVGLELAPETIAQVVAALGAMLVQRTHPEEVRKQNMLTARIRNLCKTGLTLQKAVMQAQDDVGVFLGAEGSKILIETLERESERLSKVRVEVVTEQEFEDMTRQKPH